MKLIQRIREALGKFEVLSESPKIWDWSSQEGAEMGEPTLYYICDNISTPETLVLQNMTEGELVYITEENTHFLESGEIVVQVSENDIRIIGGE